MLLRPSSDSVRLCGGSSEGRLSAPLAWLVLGPASSPAGDLPVARTSPLRAAASLHEPPTTQNLSRSPHARSFARGLLSRKIGPPCRVSRLPITPKGVLLFII